MADWSETSGSDAKAASECRISWEVVSLPGGKSPVKTHNDSMTNEHFKNWAGDIAF
jgi:hypothetical protein